MKNNTHNSRKFTHMSLVVCFALLALLVGLLYWIFEYHRLKELDEQRVWPKLETNAHPTGQPGGPPSLLTPTNLKSDPHLLGISHNVFTARILEYTGNTPTTIGPRTQYSAEVLSNIKGEIEGVVTIDQYGGMEDGTLIYPEGFEQESFLLLPGSTYLLATRYNAQEDWYTVVAHPNAQSLVNLDASSNMEVDEKILRWQEVYPEEVLPQADIINRNTKNSFASLSEAKKEEALGKAEEARGRRATPLHAQ
jgi:hypothetical protein